MSTQQNHNMRIAALGTLVLVAVMSRLLIHPWNMTATGAAALFAGAAFGVSWVAFLLPLVGIFAADLVLNNLVYANSPGVTWTYPGAIYTYAGYLVVVLMGALLLRKPNFVKVAGISVLASIVFFLVSNFGVWATSDQYPVQMYPKTWEGLMTSFAMGLPFARNTLIGDLVFAEVFFGIYAWAQMRVPSLRTA